MVVLSRMESILMRVVQQTPRKERLVRAMPLRIRFELSTVPITLRYDSDTSIFYVTRIDNSPLSIEFFKKLEAAIKADPELAKLLPERPKYAFEGLNSKLILERITVYIWGDSVIKEGGIIHLKLESGNTFFKGKVKEISIRST